MERILNSILLELRKMNAISQERDRIDQANCGELLAFRKQELDARTRDLKVRKDINVAAQETKAVLREINTYLSGMDSINTYLSEMDRIKAVITSLSNRLGALENKNDGK